MGERFSGTFLHQHGNTCTIASGSPRIWMLYSKDEYCDLAESLPAHLPKKCPRAAGRCLEGLHPLDLLQHYWELHDLGLAPQLHLQRHGEILCFPDHWFHATLNLGPSVSVALSMVRRPNMPSECPADPCEDSEGVAEDTASCAAAKRAFLEAKGVGDSCRGEGRRLEL